MHPNFIQFSFSFIWHKYLVILARSKDVEHDVKTSKMSSKMSRHRVNTNKQITTFKDKGRK